MTTTTASPSTALAVRAETAVAAPSPSSGLMRPIARPGQVLEAMEETRQLLNKTLKDGVDFGVIPGTEKDKSKPPKKTLLKPGAEKIAAAFGCRADYDVVVAEVDHDRVTRRPSEWVEAPQPSRAESDRLKAEGKGRSRKVNGDWQWQVRGQGEAVSYGLYRFVVRCTLMKFDGVAVGSGLGVCSTMESKYISRPSECENTALKMAMKRALVAAVLGTFGLSEAFTQDVGDDEDDEDARSVRSAPLSRDEGPSASAKPQRSVEDAKAAATKWLLEHCARLDRAETSEDYDRILADDKRALDKLAAGHADLVAIANAYAMAAAAKVGGFEITTPPEDVAALARLSELRAAELNK